MRQISLMGFLFLIVLIASIPAQAGFGSSGLMTIPTADNLKAQEISLSYQYFNKTGNNIISLDYGVEDAAQIGLNLETDFEGLDLYPYLKVKLFSEGENIPALAAGVIDRDRFLVGSKTIEYQDIRLHLGLGDSEKFNDYLFIGASKILNPVAIDTGDNRFEMPLTTIMTEYNNGFNLGVNLKFNDEFELDLSGLDLFRDSRDFAFKINFNNRF